MTTTLPYLCAPIPAGPTPPVFTPTGGSPGYSLGAQIPPPLFFFEKCGGPPSCFDLISSSFSVSPAIVHRSFINGFFPFCHLSHHGGSRGDSSPAALPLCFLFHVSQRFLFPQTLFCPAPFFCQLASQSNTVAPPVFLLGNQSLGLFKLPMPTPD